MKRLTLTFLISLGMTLAANGLIVPSEGFLEVWDQSPPKSQLVILSTMITEFSSELDISSVMASTAPPHTSLSDQFTDLSDQIDSLPNKVFILHPLLTNWFTEHPEFCNRILATDFIRWAAELNALRWQLRDAITWLDYWSARLKEVDLSDSTIRKLSDERVRLSDQLAVRATQLATWATQLDEFTSLKDNFGSTDCG